MNIRIFFCILCISLYLLIEWISYVLVSLNSTNFPVYGVSIKVEILLFISILLASLFLNKFYILKFFLFLIFIFISSWGYVIYGEDETYKSDFVLIGVSIRSIQCYSAFLENNEPISLTAAPLCEQENLLFAKKIGIIEHQNFGFGRLIDRQIFGN